MTGLAPHRGRRRGDRAWRDRRRRRRRGPRERGRPDHGGRVRHPGGDRLLPPAHLRRDLRHPDDRAGAELDLAPMVQQNTETQRTAFLVTVDYRHGTTTGISAADRAATIRALVDPRTRPDDLLRPGHIFPLEAREGGVLKRAGHTEAAIDLARMAGCAPVGVLCEIVSEGKHDMARRPELEAFCAAPRPADDLDRRPHPPPPAAPRSSSAASARPRCRRRGGSSTCSPSSPSSTAAATSRSCAATSPRPTRPLVRVHSECLTGDVFGSGYCQCGRTLDAAMRAHRRRGRGRARLPARTRGPRPRRRPHARRRRHRRPGHRPGARRPTVASTASGPRSSPISASPRCA